MLLKQKIIILLSLLFSAALSVSAANEAPVCKFQAGVFFTNWLVAGPLPNRPCADIAGKKNVRHGFYYDFLAKIGGEKNAAPKEGETIPDRASVIFKQFSCETPEIDFDAFFGMPNQIVAYALAFVETETNTTAYLHVGSDDGIRVWIDDKLVIDKYVERGFTPDEDWAKVFLSEGKHRILVKSEDNFGDWKFSLRFVNKKTHDKIIAAKISDKLQVNLICLTSEWGQVKVSLNIIPQTKDFPININGQWLSSDGNETQKFSAKPGAEIPIPPKFLKKSFCALSAVATGVPEKNPKVSLNIYFSSFDNIYADRAEKIQNLFNNLSSTSTTKRLLQKHRGILKFFLSELAKFKNNAQINPDINAHILLSKIDNAIDTLSQKRDYLNLLRGEYTAAYISKVDNSVQPFLLDIPDNYEAGVPMPMVIFLRDAEHKNSEFFKNANNQMSFFAVQPNARGESSAYLGLAAVDVFETIDFMTNFYSVDLDRIYILGNGMGGYGAWRIAAKKPHLFAAAAPLAAFSANIPFENLFNLPTFVAHGETDTLAPAGYSVAAADYMEKIPCPVLLNILKGVGFRLKFAVQAIKPVKWLLGNRRNPAPEEVIINNISSDFNKNSWLKIISKDNTRRQAKAIARFINANQLVLYFENVANAKISLDDKLVDLDSLLGVVLNGKYFEISAPLPTNIFISKTENSFTLSDKKPNLNIYKQGSWQNFYNGKPFMIVGGTTGDDAADAKIKQCAAALAKWSFPTREMFNATIPIKNDNELNKEDIANYNLILLGTEKQNKVVKRIRKKLITKIEKTKIDILKNNYSLEKNGLWLCQPNPENQNNLIWIYASENLDFYNTKAKWIHDWAFPAEDPPDVLLINVQKQNYSAAAHFTKKLQIEKMSDVKKSVTNNHQLITRAAKVILESANVDFVFLPKNDFPKFHKINKFFAEEIANIIFKNSMICSCSLSGENIKKIIDTDRSAIHSNIKKAKIENMKIYKIAVMPSNLGKIAKIIKLPLLDVKYIRARFNEELTLKLIK